MTAYAELQCASHFSFLRGASSAEELFAQAAVCGHHALAITDRNSLAGIVRAHEAAKVTGADFPEAAVAGQELEYGVELHEIKVKHAPEIDDQFAQDLAKVNLAELRELMRQGQSRQKAVEAEQAAQRQIVQHLVDAVDFTLPPSLLEEETEQSIHEIVSENQARGISPQLLEEKKAEIFENAAKNARMLTKFKFIAARIAEQEKIEVSNEQFARHLSGLAQREEITLDKLIERLRKNEALGLVREQVLRQAVLDFLLKEAKTE